jgi:rubrerythrin
MTEMIDSTTTVHDDSYVDFFTTGTSAKGEFHCSECGYGVTVYRELPQCPMCGGRTWEQSAWSPFGRAAARAF